VYSIQDILESIEPESSKNRNNQNFVAILRHARRKSVRKKMLVHHLIATHVPIITVSRAILASLFA
jgi:hypothetical protein